MSSTTTDGCSYQAVTQPHKTSHITISGGTAPERAGLEYGPVSDLAEITSDEPHARWPFLQCEDSL